MKTADKTRAARRALLTGTALSAVLAFALPSLAQARAAAEPGDGVVVVNPDGDAEVQAPDQTIVTAGPQAVGVLASAGRGSAVVNVGQISTEGAESHGVVAFADQGDVTVQAGSVQTSGSGAWAVSAVSNHGDVAVTVDRVQSVGEGAVGVRAIAYEGDVSISAGAVSAAGDTGATGVEVINIADEGQTRIDLGVVDVAGQGARGVSVQAVNAISIGAGLVTASGDGAVGVSTFSEKGATMIRVDEIWTEGTLALGVLGQSLAGDIELDADFIHTTGEGADAAYIESLEGDLRIRLDEVVTQGTSAYGLFARTALGQADVSLGQVKTTRDLAVGAYVAGGSGVTLRADEVQTSGYGAAALAVIAGDEWLGSRGDALVRAGRLETRGHGAAGLSLAAFGDADIAVDTISTLGDEATGLSAYVSQGDLDVVMGDVRTAGEFAKAIDVLAVGGDLRVAVESLETTGLNAGGLFAATRDGDATVLIGDARTTGYNSTAATVTARGGRASITGLGEISTTGDFAAGLRGVGSGRVEIAATRVETAGDDAVGLEAISGLWFGGEQTDRSIDVLAASVQTRGDRSHGIRVSNTDDLWIFGDESRPAGGPAAAVARDPIPRDVVIRAGSVRTEGEGAVGVLVDGAAAVRIEADEVLSRQAQALLVRTRGDVELKLNGEISGGAAGVELTGEDLAVAIARSGSVAGATDALVLSATGPYVPPAEPGPARAPGAGAVVLQNAGHVRAGSGAAVRVTSGTATIDNSGRIEGALILSDGDDQVTNTGEIVMTADNDLGLGDDLFTNRGVVRFGKAAAPQRYAFAGLERFANDGGLIDLRNERAGDVLTLSGAYAATGDARLALDIDGRTSDSLVIGGAAGGRTSIALQPLRPEDAVLLDGSLKLITVGAGTRADAFALADPDQGLVRYALRFDEKARAFQLDTSAGLSVHQSVRAVEGLRAAWRASAEAFDAEQAMARAAGGEGGRMWAMAHGSSLSRDADDDAFALGYEQELVGGQMGSSFGAVAFAGGQAVYGLTGGYVDSSLDYEDQGQEIDMRTFNLGVYGAWRNGRAFATGLVKVDSHQVEIADEAAGFTAELDGLSWGARFEAGYRLNLGAIALEPVVGLDYLSTGLDDLAVLGQSVAFEDQEGFSGRVGGQALARRELADGRAALFSAGLEMVHDFDPDQRGLLRSNGQTDEAVLTGPETYGRALVGAQFDLGRGLQTYVQGEGRFGDGQSGGGLRIGARYRF